MGQKGRPGTGQSDLSKPTKKGAVPAIPLARVASLSGNKALTWGTRWVMSRLLPGPAWPREVGLGLPSRARLWCPCWLCLHKEHPEGGKEERPSKVQGPPGRTCVEGTKGAPGGPRPLPCVPTSSPQPRCSVAVTGGGNVALKGKMPGPSSASDSCPGRPLTAVLKFYCLLPSVLIFDSM